MRGTLALLRRGPSRRMEFWLRPCAHALPPPPSDRFPHMNSQSTTILGGDPDDDDDDDAAGLTPHGAHPFAVPGDYDYARSTEENYAAGDAAAGAFVGSFADHRRTLDYAYHRHYLPARQLLQDAVVRYFLPAAAPSQESVGASQAAPQAAQAAAKAAGPQWLVVTAGAMGAGKSHCVRWLQRRGFFPKSSLVTVPALSHGRRGGVALPL
jgi:hypothetical protein